MRSAENLVFLKQWWWISTTMPRFALGTSIGVYNYSMSQEALDLLKKALELPFGERAELAGSLIESLEDAEDEAVQAAWDAEIVRRMEDLNSGRVKPTSLEEAQRRLSSAIE